MSAPASPAVGIIGAGPGGICMGATLVRAGHRNFTLYEKSGSVGGTWRDNHYPGVACDVPAHLYSLSFAPNRRWSRRFAPGAEIRAYFDRVVADYELDRHLRSRCRVVRARFEQRRWVLEDSDGAEHTCDVLVAAMGGLHLPALPDIPGRETFAGSAFHSARWDDNVELSGRRVAVVGSAASAVQIVPAIAPDVERLTVFQRTPNWIIPRRDRAFSTAERWALARVPGVAAGYRRALYWLAESRWPVFRRGGIANRLAAAWPRSYLRRQVDDPDLRAALTPGYEVGCKRILRSDDYYATLSRANVELETSPIRAIAADGLVTNDGRHHPADVIIYATGFRVFDVTGGMEIRGRGGIDLRQRWRERIAAHRSVTVPGFPNLFLLMGPNSGLGHNSVLFMIESQARYIVACLAAMKQRGWRTIEPTEDAMAAYQQELDEALDKTVWRGSCSSWYRDARGHVFTLWPGTTMGYARGLRRFDPAEFAGAR